MQNLMNIKRLQVHSISKRKKKTTDKMLWHEVNTDDRQALKEAIRIEIEIKDN